MRQALILLGLVFLLHFHNAQAAERWAVQFFHDKDESTLTINDLAFPSARRGVAVGYLEVKGKARPTALITSDGGETWSFAKIKGAGLSLFFLNESVGWMVTEKGLWKTEESGRSWEKLKSPREILRVHFQDENHGWAVGLRKSVYETTDGGAQWTRVSMAEEVKSNPDHTFFTWVAFANEKHGLIAGASEPPRLRRSMFPDWMDPERASRRRQWPTLSILLDTRDGGKHWKASVTSMFGRITRVRLAPDGRGLGLVEFSHAFEWPSEVFQIDWRTGKSTRVFRRTDRAVTDVALLPNGPAYLAAVEAPGKLRRSPIPGKLRFLRSENLSDWQEMEVDYRAVASRVTLAAFDENHIWAATDTGMILRLVED
jgi:photosystem II stability/assembly factor-like uncharacterized protein